MFANSNSVVNDVIINNESNNVFLVNFLSTLSIGLSRLNRLLLFTPIYGVII